MINQRSGYIVFDVKVLARKRRNKIIFSGEDVLVELKSAPAEDMANRELVRYFSDKLSIPQKCLSILRGRSSRNKVIKAEGITREKFLELAVKNTSR
jgi:hypothetical protein